MNSSKCQNNSNSGFTLIEVIIAMAILVFISFSIYEATIQTYRLREILTTEGDFYNGIRLSMSILQHDVALLYSPVIALPNPNPTQTPPPLDYSQMQNFGFDDPSRAYTYWAPVLDTTGLRPSRLIGTEGKLSFVSTSHIRIYKDAPESEFATITYEIKQGEKSRSNSSSDSEGSLVLTKTESPNAFVPDDLKDATVRTYELLHGIRKASFTYFQREGNTWKTFRSWDSNKEETKNLYPSVIELKLEVVGPKNQIFEGIYKLKPEIPLNGINPST